VAGSTRSELARTALDAVAAADSLRVTDVKVRQVRVAALTRADLSDLVGRRAPGPSRDCYFPRGSATPRVNLGGNPRS